MSALTLEELLKGSARVLPRRTMVVVAHPGDELLGAGGLIPGSEELLVLHVTDGAPRDRRLWPRPGPVTRELYAKQRERETRSALAAGGVFPQVRCLRCIEGQAAENLVPLALGLLRLVQAYFPQVVITQPYEGGHPDHDATAFLVHAALRLSRQQLGGSCPALVEMPSFHGGGGADFARGVSADGEPGQAIYSLGSRQRELKERMLAEHESQRRAFAGVPLGTERFRRAPAYDFGWSLPQAASALQQLGLNGGRLELEEGGVAGRFR